MNNAYVMSLPLEAKKNQQAAMITGGFALLLIILMFFLKWKLPVFEKITQEVGIEVELNLPPDPPIESEGGGGGGGNIVQASGPAGVANHVPPAAGEKEDSKDIETDDNDKTAPEIKKPANPKPEAKKVIENTSIAKETPKVIETPAPPKPKAVAGRTLTGTGKGGGADDYDKSGGTGPGYGVGKGPGTGGGTGGGNGGGNGPGSGPGTGPKVTRGDRKIIRHYSFEGDLEKAVVYANINVTPEGVGKFVSIARGSTHSSNSYKDAIVRYLQNIKFDRADHESMVTVQFNFRVN